MSTRLATYVNPGEHLGVTFDYGKMLAPGDTITSVHAFTIHTRRGTETLTASAPAVASGLRTVTSTIQVPDGSSGTVWVMDVTVQSQQNLRLSLSMEFITN